uniref:PID domain-containing protein n=1 Tax=Glossina austeni TaxID=7395 RepID=A0A1A9VRS3_GLOAU
MALRLRRDVQKASYYVWFLGAEEAKGLRGQRVINSVLPYLVDRSRAQEPIKVTLQVSHKGIKIIQGSSKHFVPHSAITSSMQTDDIVACVLLLYNPATKCPLHVHAYRCDSETTAEALHQQLQILINRPENQKRFEELESRLGIMPHMTSSSILGNKTGNHIDNEHNQTRELVSRDFHSQKHQYTRRQHELSPKRFNSSLGSDTGNSTRDSECSEENSVNSPVSHSPPAVKPPPSQQQNNELFDSLAAELRAKLNGNGPPLLLPPRDYDTVHRSKGNLTAIELRRCRNTLIVGSTPPLRTADVSQSLTLSNGKIVSSRGSSGIGSDLAPSPERQELNSSSDDEHWTNEADSSVIALKPSQISLEHSRPIISHHAQLNRKSAIQPAEDSYLRDLPSKPYSSRSNHSHEKVLPNEREKKNIPSSSNLREDEIKPVIKRPADYDVKINRILQSEQRQIHKIDSNDNNDVRDRYRHHDVNDTNRVLKKNLSLDRDSSSHRFKDRSRNSLNDFDEADIQNNGDHHLSHAKENSSMAEKPKFIEYAPNKNKPHQVLSYAAEETRRYGGKHRYVDPADLPFEQNSVQSNCGGIHKGTHSPERCNIPQNRCAERPREHARDIRDIEPTWHHSREHEPENFPRNKERNPYREPESIPYIESIEKMIKSSAIRYKAFEVAPVNAEPVTLTKEPLHSKLSQRSRTLSQHEENRDYAYNAEEFSRSSSSSKGLKDRFKENAKEKFRAAERSGSRHVLSDDKDDCSYKTGRKGTNHPDETSARRFNDWGDEERIYDSPPTPEIRSRSRVRDQWMEHVDKISHREKDRMSSSRIDTRNRESSSKRSESRDSLENRDYHHHSRYREKTRDHSRERIQRTNSREYNRRDYSPDSRSTSDRSHHRQDQGGEKRKDDLYSTQDASSHNNIGKNIPNMPKGYRHSYAEPVFPRSAGRVGLAAVNPY